ncbi:MAG: hypothetical protein ACFB21_11555 [Opitutales bacterium]
MKACIRLSSLMALLPAVSLAEPADWADWYEFDSTQTFAESPLSLADWFKGRAGEHGRVAMVVDELVYNGKPLHLWGLNLCYDGVAPDKELADQRADWYQRIGMNSVRLHKYADGGGWAGVMSDHSITEFDPQDIDRMDYLVATFAEHGIYTLLSPNFGVKILPEDRSRIPWFDEIGKSGDRLRVGHGSVFLSKELQDLQIDILVKTLNHTNPYTGMRYAEDPAIWCVEIFNEDAVLFYGTNSRLQGLPTIRARNAGAFSEWLLAKYGSEAAWREAWGAEVIFGGEWDSVSPQLRSLVGPDNVAGELPVESLAEGTVVPWGQPWFYENALKPGNGEATLLRTRLIDTMNFLTEQMDAFYARFEKAIRETGYEGVIMGSNWQTGDNVSHFHNLYSDYKVGLIDRHNYFRGPRHALNRNRGAEMDLNLGAMVSDPGGAVFSSGMQQVIDRPFMLSEWIHEQPSEWQVEGPAIIGAYGMGLNGWDASYIFQNRDNAQFVESFGTSAWEVMSPMVAGSFFAISRQVLRGDVQESPLVVPLKVHPESLREGVATADFRMRQALDAVPDKILFGSDCPLTTPLAARRQLEAATSDPGLRRRVGCEAAVEVFGDF